VTGAADDQDLTIVQQRGGEIVSRLLHAAGERLGLRLGRQAQREKQHNRSEPSTELCCFHRTHPFYFDRGQASVERGGERKTGEDPRGDLLYTAERVVECLGEVKILQSFRKEGGRR